MSGNSMQSLQIFCEGSWEVRTRVYQETPYFCGKDVAKSLGYTNPREAVRVHTFEEDRSKLEDIRGERHATPSKNEQGATVYITEAGVYGLIFGSQKEEARAFEKWVCQHVLPRLRKAYQAQCQAPLCLQSETDLHNKVVQAIRRFYPQAVLVAGLGELQDTSDKRIEAWRKGYTAGQPDILLLNHHAKWNGFALELKNPKGTGRLSDKQARCLDTYRTAGFKTLVSDCYDSILLEIFEYMQQTRLQCLVCKHKFKTQKTLDRHLCCFHRCC